MKSIDLTLHEIKSLAEYAGFHIDLEKSADIDYEENKDDIFVGYTVYQDEEGIPFENSKKYRTMAHSVEGYEDGNEAMPLGSPL